MFTLISNANANAKNPNDLLKFIVLYFVILIVMTFVLKFFWNRALVKHVTILKPITSLMDSLMLAIGLTLIQ